jgi:hypothetical protein
VQAALVITVEDWPRLTRLFEEFGAANGLSFRNGNFDRPGTIRALNLRLCNDRGLSIHVFGEHWERGGGVSALRTDGIFLGISELRDGSDWQHPARALIGELETHWPGSVHQRKEGSRAIFPFAPDQLQETK